MIVFAVHTVSEPVALARFSVPKAVSNSTSHRFSLLKTSETIMDMNVGYARAPLTISVSRYNGTS